MARRVLLAIVALCSGAADALAQQSIPIQFGSSMRYLSNSSDPGLGTSWTADWFPDAGWAAGFYGVGYENATGAEDLLLTTVPAGTRSVYTRATFTVADVSSIEGVLLGVDYDDGYVAWINGVEVYRSSEMPAGGPAWNAAPALHEASNGQVPNYQPLRDISPAALPVLHEGVNLLAIGIWNNATTSSDLVLVPQLILSQGTTVTRGPYLQMGTPASVVVRWRTSVATDSRVLFGASPAGLTSSVSNPVSTMDHVATLSGLEPETTYYYAVGTSAEILAGGDADHSFLTSPPGGAARTTRVWALGDSGTANSNARAVRDAYDGFAGAIHTDLWLMLGDNAYQDGTDAEYQAAVFDTYPSMLRKSVLWPTYGNHDGHSADSGTQTGPYYEMFTLPGAAQAGGVSSGTEAYYSFDRGNIHFVCLDSYESDRLLGGAMMTWLEQDLLSTTEDWIVAFWHHPPYSKGSHDSDAEGELVEMRENALRILEDHGVDLVLCGHSHSYERSFLIDGHYGLSGTFSESHKKDGGDGRPGSDGPYQKPQLGPDPNQGAVYAVAGSSGQISGGPLNHPAMFISLNSLGSMVLDFKGNRLDAMFLNSTGDIADSFTIQKGPPLAPGADFVASPIAGSAPLMVGFVDRSTNSPTGWTWDFELDGTPDALTQNPSRTFTSPGTYSVSLTASNGAGSGGTIRTSYICVASTPSAARITGLAIAADHQTVSWDPQPSGTVYDVVKGNLAALHASGGDFSLSLIGCLVNDGTAPQAADSQAPGPGGGFYYLVRSIDCAGTPGSFDSVPPGQVGSRDAEIASSAARCP